MPRRAFTLIELLVVISLITLLISMTLPSLGKSKRVARTAVCLTSQHQMAIGTDAYTVDNKGFYPPYDNVNNLRYESFWMTVYDKYHGDDRIRDCPETIEDPRVWGTAHLRWGPAPALDREHLAVEPDTLRTGPGIQSRHPLNARHDIRVRLGRGLPSMGADMHDGGPDYRFGLVGIPIPNPHP